MGILTALTAIADTAKGADSAGIINLKKMFTLPGSETPSGQDSEYEKNVEATINQEVNYGQEAIDKLGITDSNNPIAQKIINLTQSAIAEWGSKGNYTRNVAKPDAFYSQIDSILKTAKENNLAFSDVNTPSGQQYDPKNIITVNNYSKKNGTPTTEVPQTEKKGSISEGTENIDFFGVTPAILIGAILIIAIIAFKK